MRTRDWRRYQRDLRIQRSVARLPGSRSRLEWYTSEWNIAKDEGKRVLRIACFCQDCKGAGCKWCWSRDVARRKYEKTIDYLEFKDYELNGLY